jgi:hypothetical protein
MNHTNRINHTNSIIHTNNINQTNKISEVLTSNVHTEPVGSGSGEAAPLNNNTVTDNNYELEDDINFKNSNNNPPTSDLNIGAVSVTYEYQKFLDSATKDDISKRRTSDPGFSSWLVTRLDEVKTELFHKQRAEAQEFERRHR